MTTDSNRENLALVLALSRSYQEFIRAIKPAFKRAGLTSSQWDILETLSVKGALTVNELLDFVLGTSGNLDVVIKNLIGAGLVTKSVSTKDRRARVVELTVSGQAKVAEFYPVHNRALEEIFGCMPGLQKREQVTILNQLRKQIVAPVLETNNND